jgi:branched-chain amino acid transport system substrate-binding protein
VSNEIAGRKIELLIEDDQAQPDVALTKTKKLVERDQVHVLMGIIWSPNAVAVRDYIHAGKIPIVISEAAVRPITQEARSPNIFRTSIASGQMTRPFGAYVCGKLGYKRVAAIGFDSVFGKEQADFLEIGCNESGGKVIQKIFAPVGTPDFAPYLAQITQSNPDAVWAIWSGAAAIRFLQQYKEFGLKEKFPLVGFGALTDETVVKAVGDAALGIVTNYFYTPALDTRENRRFVQAYRQKYGEDPGVFSDGGYTAARVIREAARANNGEVEDREKFLRALRAVKFEDPRGPFRFDAFQNSILNVYIRKVERADGRLVNKVLDTLREVEQYWPKGKPQP